MATIQHRNMFDKVTVMLPSSKRSRIRSIVPALFFNQILTLQATFGFKVFAECSATCLFKLQAGWPWQTFLVNQQFWSPNLLLATIWTDQCGLILKKNVSNIFWYADSTRLSFFLTNKNGFSTVTYLNSSASDFQIKGYKQNCCPVRENWGSSRSI